ncbi:MAG: hypothetical protein RRZ83_00385 [Alistipes sp.]
MKRIVLCVPLEFGLRGVMCAKRTWFVWFALFCFSGKAGGKTPAAQGAPSSVAGACRRHRSRDFAAVFCKGYGANGANAGYRGGLRAAALRGATCHAKGKTRANRPRRWATIAAENENGKGG